MIDIMFEKCCENCADILACADTNKSVLGDTRTIVYCEHMNVCRMYYSAKCNIAGKMLREAIGIKDEVEEVNADS